MMKRLIISIAVLAMFGALLYGLFAYKAMVGAKMAYAMAHRKIPPVVVSTATATRRTWAQRLHAVADVVAVRSVQVSAQISGNVTAIYFHSGQRVNAGQRLVQLDNSTQLAQLRLDQANARLARINVHRDQQLIAQRAVSQAQLDTDTATLAADNAKVAQDQAVLNKLRIVAPFTGYLGIRQVSLGQYVSPGTAIVALNSWRPIYADFYVPQNDLPMLHLGQTVTLAVDAYPTVQFTGTVAALSSQVNTLSRNIQVRARLANKGERLKPGMFGSATVTIGTKHVFTTIPATAITYNTFGDFVYRVVHSKFHGQPMLIAKQVYVKAGPQRGNEVPILSGIRAGDTVVTAGQVKLRPGSPIAVNNSVQP